MRKTIILLLLPLVLCSLATTAHSTMILTENFDGVTPPSRPAAWQSVVGNGTTGVWQTNAGSHYPSGISAHSGANVIYFNSSSLPQNYTSALISPPFSLVGFTGAKISFWMYRDNSYGSDKIDVHVSTTPGVPATSPLTTINRYVAYSPAVAGSGWYNYTVEIPDSFNSATNYLVINGISAYGMDIHLDDIQIVYLPEQIKTTIAAGGSHSLMIKNDGTLWGWGLNTKGQLGDGSTSNRPAPVKIGSSNSWSSIAAGTDFTAALKNDGTLWSWGNNVVGQLGYSTSPATYKELPLQIGSASNWTSVSAGPDYTMAIQSDGTLWGWGVNGVGKLGDGTTANSTTPKRIGSDTDWALVNAGTQHTLALKKDGTLWAWGANGSSRLGDGTTTSSLVPKRIGTDTSWVSIVAGSDYSFGIKKDGTIWAWGNNVGNRLGVSGNATTPTNSYASGRILRLFGGGVAGHVLALKDNGTLYAWGNNINAQLGLGINEYSSFSSSFRLIDSDTNWSGAATGASHTVAVKLNASVTSWGGNSAGQLGYWTNNAVDQKFPVLLSPLKLAGGLVHSLAIAPDGTLWGWGSNSSGQLGLGIQSSGSEYPAQLDTGTFWQAVAAGKDFSLAIKSDGTLWQWGKDIGSYGNTSVLTKVGSDSNWAQVTAGFDHALALKTDGSMWAWGNNDMGQLGDYTSHAVPYQIGNSGLNSGAVWNRIAAGTKFSAAIRSDGTLWTWGDYSCGQGGNGSNLGQVNYESNWLYLAAGRCHVLAAKTGISYGYPVYAWGENDLAQLGLGTQGGLVNIPTSLSTFYSTQGDILVQTGSNHSLALNKDGELYGWGDNTFGQLTGYYVGGPKSVPTPISGTWAAAAAGSDHTLGQSADGILYTWGRGENGQLGAGYGTTSNPTPVSNTPNLSGFISTSNNAKSPSWATTGDSITLSFTSNIPMPKPVVLISGQPATVTGTGTLWIAKRLMTIQDPEGSIDYDIRFASPLNGTASIVSGYSGITFDRTPPIVNAVTTNPLAITSALNQGYNVYIYGTYTESSTPSCKWSQIAGPANAITFQNSSSCDTWIGSNSNGVYTLRLTVTDHAGNSAISDYSVLWDSTPPLFTSVSITSNDIFNAGYVKEGDTITLAFTTSETVQPPQVSIMGTGVTATGGGVSWSAQLPITNANTINYPEGQVTFSILIRDPAGNSTNTSSITTGSTIRLDKTVPTITQISIQSTNPNPLYAKAGDTVNLTFTSSETILTPTVTMSGHSVTPTSTGNNWTASYVMTAQDTERIIPFSIAPTYDPAGHVSTAAITATTNGSSVTFDKTLPTVGITVPVANFMDLTSPTDIVGTTSDLSTVTKVELQVYATPSDTIFRCMYVNGSSLAYGSCPSNPAPWVIVTTPVGTFNGSAWSVNVNNLFSSNATYTINVRATDRAGNVSPIVSANFTRVATLYGTKLYATPLSTVLLANGTTTVQGQLTLLDSTKSISLINQIISVTVKDSNGTQVSGSPFSGSTSDAAGHFSISNVGGIALPGSYKIQAHFTSAVNQGTGLTPSDSPEYILTVGSQPGYAVIVQGRIVSGEGLQAHARTANRIYKTLRDRGFQPANIKYLGPAATNPDAATADGVTLESTPVSATAIQNAIVWAKGQMVSSPAPFYLIMVDHGVSGSFRIDTGSTVVSITPPTLNNWLSVLDSDTTSAAQKQVVMIGSCYSGSFIEALKRQGRVVITSAAANEESYKGPLEQPDNIRSGEYFLDALFHELNVGYSLTASFRNAAGKTRDFTRQGWDLSANSLYGDSAVQHPLLDDTGDGTGVNQVSDQGGDGAMAATMYLGVGDTRTNAVDPGEILAVTPTSTLANGSSDTLWLQHIVSQGGDNAVSAWAEVRRPDIVIPSQQSQVTEQVTLSLDTVPLVISGGSANGLYNSFTTPGKYEIFYYTRKQSGAISEARRSVVYKRDLNGTGPLPFSSVAPTNNNTTQKSNGIVFIWNPTSDGDSNQLLRTPVTYTLIVCDNPSFDGAVPGAYYKKIEEMTDTFAKLDKADGIADSKQYFWKVIATDLYGNTTETPSWNFTVNDNTNLPIRYYYKGTVLDADTKIPVSGVTVAISGSAATSWTTITNGRYLVSNDSSEASTITASLAGYLNAAITVSPIYSTDGANYVDNTFYFLAPTYPLTLNFSGNGDGSVNGGISCLKGGSCPPLAIATNSTVSLTPSPNATSSVFGGWSGACTNTSGTCTVTINGTKTVTASFSLSPVIKLDVNAVTGYDIFSDAYANATGTLFSMNTIIDGAWTLTGGKAIVLRGGYLADYTSRNDSTVLRGKMTVQNGSLRVDSVKVR